MTRIGNWLCRTMTKERLNHVMLLSIDKESTNVLELIDIVKMFCEKKSKKHRVLSVFYEEDLRT